MIHCIPRFAILIALAPPLHAQTVLEFHPEHSGMRTQGSKIDLVFDPFTIRPTVADPDAITITIEYPVYGSNTPTVEKQIKCLGIQWRFDDVLELDVITACLEGEIHDTDDLVTLTISLDQGWATNSTDNEESEAIEDFAITHQSTVDYPQAITSWDIVPHQIHGEEFHVDLVVFHRYSFEQSEYGDFDIEVWIDENPEEEEEPPTNEVVLSATARPAFKVPQRDDIGAGTYLVYRATFDPAQFIPPGQLAPADGPAYVHFKITPSRGDADSIRYSDDYLDANVWRTDLVAQGTQPNIETMKVFLNGGGTLDNDEPWYAVVDPDPMVGDDEEGDWYDNPGDARGDPFRTIFRAVQAMPDDLANPVILLREGAIWPGRDPEDEITGDGIDKAGANWLTIMPDLEDGVERADVDITDVAMIISSSAPGNALFSITNASDDDNDIQIRWQSGDDEGLQIVGDGFDVTISRAGRTVAQMVQAINEDPDLGDDVSATGLNFTSFSVDVGGLYYDDVSEFAVIPVGTTEILANSVVWTRFEGGSIVRVFSELMVKDYPSIDFPNASAVVAEIEADFAFMTGEVVHNVLQPNLQPREYRIPAIFPDHKTWFEADINTNGLRYPLVRYFDCTIRSCQLTSNEPGGDPAHLWLDQALIQQESKVAVDSVEIVTTPGNWNGGIWFTRSDWDTVRQCTNGPVMVRDAWFRNIGGDTGKQVSYAANWFGEDVAPAQGDLVHADFFQWSTPDLEGNDNHGNIIAMNLDFRDEDNVGQPFLFNVPDNDNIDHDYTGIALVNLRMNSKTSQQFCGDVDHLLIWDSDVFQDGSTFRRLHLRGVPTSGDHTSIYHNVSVRNTVVERMFINGASGAGQNQFPGDMPSLWAVLDSCHITTELWDEGGDVSTFIDTYPGTQDGSSPGDLVDLETDWHPVEGQPSLLDRLAAGQIVYRMDAAGKERVIDGDPLAAVGAMEDPTQSEGQPCELDAYLINTGSLTSGELADLVLSDDLRMLVLSAGFTPVAELIVFGKTEVASPTEIELVFEGKLGSGTITTAKLRLFNFNTPGWDIVDTFTISSTEAVRIKTGVSPTNYIEEGMILFAIRLAPSLWISPDFTLHADQMKIVVK